MAHRQALRSIIAINIITCLALTGLSISLVKNISWIDKPSLIVMSVFTLILFLNRASQLLVQSSEVDLIMNTIVPLISNVGVFSSAIVYLDHMFKHFNINSHINLIITHLSLLLLHLMISGSLNFAVSNSVEKTGNYDLEEQIQKSKLHIVKNTPMKSSEQTLRPEADWWMFKEGHVQSNSLFSDTYSTTTSSTVTKIGSFFNKFKTAKSYKSDSFGNTNKLKTQYVTRLSDIPDMSYYNENLELPGNETHDITILNLEKREQSTEAVEQFNAEKNALHRINSILLPPCLNPIPSLKENASSSDDEIPSLPRNLSLNDIAFKTHENVETKVKNSPFVTDPQFSFPLSLQSHVVQQQKINIKEQKINILPQSKEIENDTVENLDKFLNFRKKSLYPDIDEAEMFQEGASNNAAIKNSSPTTLPPLITSEMGLHSTYIHHQNKSKQEAYHSPARSTHSIGSGVLASMLFQGSPTTSPRSSSRRNSLKHKPSISVSSFSTVKQIPFDTNKTTNSSPTRSTKGARLKNKLSLSNISFSSEFNSHSGGFNNHKRGKSSMDFSYLTTLQQAAHHSPKKSLHSIKDHIYSNNTTMNLSFDTTELSQNIKDSKKDRRIESGESAKSGQTMESLDYPQILVSEYDKEKWRIMSEMNV